MKVVFICNQNGMNMLMYGYALEKLENPAEYVRVECEDGLTRVVAKVKIAQTIPQALSKFFALENAKMRLPKHKFVLHLN